jgi:PhnB protein
MEMHQDAIEFYKTSLNAEVLFIQKAGEVVAHSVLRVGEAVLMVSDTIPGQTHQRRNQVNICITINDVEKAKQLYESLSQDGQVNISLGETDFSPAYGMVTDKFGVTFQIFTKIQNKRGSAPSPSS